MNIRADQSSFSVAANARAEAFKQDIAKAVRETIAHLDRGTVGISQDCLWALTVSRISRSPNVPQGTNAGYFAKQVFLDVVSHSVFKNFVYES